mmetsp:Transcript_3532/g.9137  ORF Transcript_3532/g.9137 Transcript_3532/m.9137 type:complete len:238 (-) Transcript_3532:397-1110(-)
MRRTCGVRPVAASRLRRSSSRCSTMSTTIAFGKVWRRRATPPSRSAWLTQFEQFPVIPVSPSPNISLRVSAIAPQCPKPTRAVASAFSRWNACATPLNQWSIASTESSSHSCTRTRQIERANRPRCPARTDDGEGAGFGDGSHGTGQPILSAACCAAVRRAHTIDAKEVVCRVLIYLHQGSVRLDPTRTTASDVHQALLAARQCVADSCVSKAHAKPAQAEVWQNILDKDILDRRWS